jgi:conjugative transposon TraJ protein
MTGRMRAMYFMAVGMICPVLLQAQDSSDGSWADSIRGLHKVLDQIYTDMLPLCTQLIGVGSGIAGFAALFYIAYRVWGHLSRAEPIDFYPLFRPFVIGFCVLNFMGVINMINGLLQPTVTATNTMVNNSDVAIRTLLAQKEQALQNTDTWKMYVGPSGEGDPDRWYKYTHPEDPTHENEGWMEGIGNDLKFAMAKAGYNFRNAIKEVIAEILQLLFAAASLCINTLRTFNLIVLAILGPLVFAISVFDGFHHTLRQWVARYINYFLWLPVANIFGVIIGKIQENMLKLDLSQIGSNGDTFFSRTDAGYLVFLLIGIIGYTTIPSIANYIVFAGGGGMTRGVTSLFMGGANMVTNATANTAMGGVTRLGAGVSNAYHSPGHVAEGYQSGSTGRGGWAAAGRAYGQVGHYMRNKLKGNDHV